MDREEAISNLAGWHRGLLQTQLGFDQSNLATAEQVHGHGVAVVTRLITGPAMGADALISNTRGIVLGIYVADCCAVYLVDQVTGAFGVVHSGKKGTEQNITGMAIRALVENFGTRPENLVVQLSPCIRPPAYEIDFAVMIRQQAIAAGVRVSNVHDDGICTSSDPARYYSYRMERGKTGRMLALLGRH
ncbi:MAG: polyphenol oxidase family protein [Verrucomicrobia bacterium]|nr:polyphenol oxidase family protein [Verrucomicrobiota bacterium]